MNNEKYDSFRGEIVKKSNVINEGMYTLDTAEKYKLFYLMVAQISTQDKMPESPADICNREYSFYLEDYADLKGIVNKYSFEDFVSNVISYLEERTAITIRGENFIETIWVFDSVRFDKDLKGTKITFRFGYSISKYLFELKDKFTRYHIKNIMPMRSKYSIRLYEVLKQYESVGERAFTVDELREVLGTRVYVIDKKTKEKVLLRDEYKDFPDLKKKVIKKAIEEVNEYSDLEIVDVKYKREGRFIKYVIFKFRRKSVPAIPYKEEGIFPVKSDKVPVGVEAVWRNIAEFRKLYQPFIKEIMEYVSRFSKDKVNPLTENQILFLFINANKDIFTDEIIKEIIKKAVVNKNLNNVMGFLINSLGIDVNNANFRELILTDEKVDNKVVEKSIEEKIAEGKPARKYFMYYLYSLKEDLDDITLKILQPVINSSVYLEDEKTVYLVFPDKLSKIFFEDEFLDSFREFLSINYGINRVVTYVKKSVKES